MVLCSAVAVTACSGDAAAPATAPTTDSAPTLTTVGETTAAVEPTTPALSSSSFKTELPPPALPLRRGVEIDVGTPDLGGLLSGDDWLFAVVPPSTLVRVDPRSGDVARLDLGLGESREGVVRHAYVGGSVWAIGGPFRDTLVEVDPSAMTESRRIVLGDDHSIRQHGRSEGLWLLTLRGVRPVDVSTGEVGDVVALEVDPAGVATAPGAVWVTLPAAAQVARIDTVDGSVELIDTEPGPVGIAVEDGIVWVTHPPTASISRIDASSGRVLGVTDVDIWGVDASVTDIPGFNVTAGAVWALVRLAGSPYEPILVKIDPGTGEVRAARTVQVRGTTWEATDETIWFHRANNSSIVAVDVGEFDDAAPTALSELAAPASSVPEPSPAPTSTPDERAVTDAFERLTDPNVPGDDLALGRLTATRDALLDLLTAQAGGEARLTDVSVDGDRAIARFDVILEGETVLLPGIEFVFERRRETSAWAITDESLCAVAAGVGIACP